jgi:hypothetical protein
LTIKSSSSSRRTVKLELEDELEDELELELEPKFSSADPPTGWDSPVRSISNDDVIDDVIAEAIPGSDVEGLSQPTSHPTHVPSIKDNQQTQVLTDTWLRRNSKKFKIQILNFVHF